MTDFLTADERETLALFFQDTGDPMIRTMLDLEQNHVFASPAVRATVMVLYDKGMIEHETYDAVRPTKAAVAYRAWLARGAEAGITKRLGASWAAVHRAARTRQRVTRNEWPTVPAE